MIQKYLRFCALLWALGAPGYLFAFSNAHPASVRGTVRSQADALPLAGATLRIANTPYGTVTDESGHFQFIDLEPQRYQLIASFLGYESDTLSFDLSADNTVEIDIALKDAPTELAGVEILAGQQAPLEILQRVDLRLRPVNSSQDFLRLVPGLLIAQHAGGGKAEQIFMRGFDLDHGTDVLVEVDGMPVNMVSHAHGQGYADLHFLIPETVGGLDVDKGPYQADNGNLATAGAVRFRTRQRFDRHMVKMEIGQFGHQRGVGILALPAQNKGQGGYLAGEFLRGRGYFESPQDLRRLNAQGKYSWQLGPKTQLTTSISAFQSSWDASGQIPERAVRQGLISRWGAIDDTEGGQTARYNAQIQLQHELNDGSRFNQQLYYSRYHFDLYSNFTFFLNDPINGDQIWQTERRNMLGYRGEWTKAYELGGMDARTVVGFGFRDDAVHDVGLARTRNRSETLESLAWGDVQESNGFAYVEQSLQVAPRLQVVGGLRFDAFSFRYENALEAAYRPERAERSIASPKLQLNYQAAPNLALYVQAGTGFHSNDTRTVLQESGREILPRAYGSEVGMQWKPRSRMLVNAAVWGLDLDQEFVYVGDEGIVEPSGKTRRVGLDLSWRYQLTDWLFADADFNFSRPRSREVAAEEAFIPLSPTFSSVGGFSVQLPGGFQAALRYRHLSPRPANETWTLTADGYTLVDANLSYAFRKGIVLGISASNLLNQEWNEAQFETTSQLAHEPQPTTEIHYTPGSPLSVRSSLTFQF